MAESTQFVEHHIQQKILNILMHHEVLRFSELKPKELESNIFMYHLKSLIRQGYVDKCAAGYLLAPKGLHYVDILSNTNLKPRKQPKILAILVVKNDAGLVLMAKRKVQPYINLLMFPSGKQHIIETINEHTSRESLEKLGVNIDFTYKGMAEIVILEKGIIISHVIAHVQYASADISLPKDDDRFSYSWYDLNNTGNDLFMPGTKEIYRELAKSDKFLLSMRFNN